MRNMNWEVTVDQNGLGLFSQTVYVEAPNIIKAIEAAEKHVTRETAARPGDCLTTSAKLADAQRIIKTEALTA